MKTLCTILALSASLLLAGERNILDQSTRIPEWIGNVQNPDINTRRAAGWRIEPKIPALATNMTRVSCVLSEGDGVTGRWVVIDRLTSEIQAEEAAAQAERETARQLAKSIELKTTENTFIGICQQLTGKPDKFGFPELEKRITELMATDKDTAVVLTLKLLATDAAGKRYGGNQWWDDCIWHQEIVNP
jgi:hypothetical protein